jgi:hypothetical protein
VPQETLFRDEGALKVTFKTLAPVFIVGAARSGTTILRQLIRKYFDINFGTEGKFIVPLYKRFKKFPKHSPTAEQVITDLLKRHCFVRWQETYGFHLDTSRLKSDLQELTCRNVVDAVFRQFTEFAGRTRWGDKNPGYTPDLPILNTIYPEAQFVHMIRDGRDVTLSLLKEPFGPRNVMQAALYWKKQIELARAFGATLSSQSYFELRYEDLMQQPVTEMSRLAVFLQIDDKLYDAVISRVQENIKNDLKHENFYKWKHAMSASEVTRFEKAAGNVLAELGYEVVRPFERGPNLLENSMSFLDDRFRRYSNFSYVRRRIARLGQR